MLPLTLKLVPFQIKALSLMLPVEFQTHHWTLLRGNVVAKPEDVYSCLSKLDCLSHPQLRHLLADRMCQIFVEVEICEQVLHSPHQPGRLEDGLVKLTSDGKAAVLNGPDRFGDPIKSVVGIYVGPVKRENLLRGCEFTERMEPIFHEMFHRSAHHPVTPLIPDNICWEWRGIPRTEVRLLSCRADGDESRVKAEILCRIKRRARSLVINLHQPGGKRSPTDLEWCSVRDAGAAHGSQDAITRVQELLPEMRDGKHRNPNVEILRKYEILKTKSQIKVHVVKCGWSFV